MAVGLDSVSGGMKFRPTGDLERRPDNRLANVWPETP